MSRMTQLPSPRPASRASETHSQEARTNVSSPSHADYVGVGIVFDEQLRVLNLVKGGAAERHGGILRYDLLLAVDGRSMAAASTEQLKIAVRGPPGSSPPPSLWPRHSLLLASGTSVVLTFSRKDQPSYFDVVLVRAGLAPPPPAASTQKIVPATSAPETAPADHAATALSNTSVMQSLYAAIDAARLDVAQKEEEVSVLARQLQSANFHCERERAASAAADARRLEVVDVVQQLDEEAQVEAYPNGFIS